MLSLVNRYNTLILNHPTSVNFLSGGLLAFSGDVLCQKALEAKDQVSWPRGACKKEKAEKTICARLSMLVPLHELIFPPNP